MAYIQTDHQQLKATAAAVDTYVETLKTDMKKARQQVYQLTRQWEGPDAEAYRERWVQASEQDSTYGQMVKTLQNYADYLRYAAEQYRNAQSNAVNRANGLPK